ncbi:unnamed protein product [Auanema sp. JU1783]|nr:unnamed protein product [Auanema sp. JU1783]
MPKIRKCDWILFIIAVLCAVASIVTWVTFPIIYPNSVKSHLQFKQNKDFSLSLSAWLFSHPPITNVMNFYFFNVTNPDEMIYAGAKPMLIEIGPYAVIETEEKKYLNFSKDSTMVFYQNYKKYVIHKELSCPGCSFDSIFTIPNPPETGAAADMYNPRYNVTPTTRIIIAASLLLLGEYPFISQSVGDILFDGYDDALLSAAHSNIVNILTGLNGGVTVIPIPVPAMPRMGFFQGYNNTNDESYWVKTGKENIDEIAKVVTWANVSSLPQSWWTTDYARSIRGSDSASFSKMHLKKTDIIEGFQSFQCRSFNATYLKEETVHNIPGWIYSVPYEEYDTTSDQNRGFRYENSEKVNYYPDWPACPQKNSSECAQHDKVDCSASINFCHNCCERSFVNGTYLLPPGMFPLVCYPGRLQPSPFSVMYSPPHFLYSPPEVINSVYGLNPSYEKHLPMLYTHEPYSGTVLKVIYQLMVSTPVFANPIVVTNMHLPNSIVPMFWQGANAILYDSVYNEVWLGFVLVPKLVDGIKYFLLALSLFIILVIAFLLFKRRKSKAGDMEDTMVTL